MVRVRGIAFIGAMQFVKEEFGPESAAQFAMHRAGVVGKSWMRTRAREAPSGIISIRPAS